MIRDFFFPFSFEAEDCLQIATANFSFYLLSLYSLAFQNKTIWFKNVSSWRKPMWIVPGSKRGTLSICTDNEVHGNNTLPILSKTSDYSNRACNMQIFLLELFSQAWLPCSFQGSHVSSVILPPLALPAAKFTFSCCQIFVKHLSSLFTKCVLVAVGHLLLHRLDAAQRAHCSSWFLFT